MAVSKTQWISNYRQNVYRFIAAINEFSALKAEYDALSYSSGLTDEDFVDGNAGITAAEMRSAVSSGQTICSAFSNTVHATNLYKVKA